MPLKEEEQEELIKAIGDELMDGVTLEVTDTEEIKSIKERVIAGVGIRFSDHTDSDSYSEFFNANTVTGLRSGDTRPFIMEHGYGKFGVEILAYAQFEKSAVGWEYQATFEDTPNGNKAYNEIISKPYYSSSGAPYNTVRRERVENAYWLKSWFVGEMTGTQRPADRSTKRLTRVKSAGSDTLMARIDELQFELNHFKSLTEGFDKMKEFYYSFIEQQKMAEIDNKIKAVTSPIKPITIQPTGQIVR